ncbi:MAG: hypothetical protein QOF05_1559 [Sphingomonadales bacterium]|nr:hypothetical protein [Sphingomonadales bacterium]
MGVVPGAETAEDVKNTVEIEDTSDVNTDAYRRVRGVAENYAAKYNETIVSSRK